MADIQLTFPYKTAVTREGKLIAWAFWPLWALLAPICILLTLAAIAVYPAIFAPTVTAALLGLPALVIAAGAAFTAIAQDDCLHVSKEGLYLPRVLMPKVGFAKYIPWDRLVRADITDTGNLRLAVRGAGSVDIPLGGAAPGQVEQLLLAIELWAENCEMSPHLVTYQLEVQNSVKGIAKISYTQMWEQELASRFTPTTFVPLDPGATIHGGRLKVIRQLAFGGFSAIYLIQDEVGKFAVAKEAVLPQSVDTAARNKAQEHFAREARILSNLSHPGVARVFDCFCENGRDYILMEHIDGQNLRQLVNGEGPQPVEKVRKWAEELAAILDYLHSQSPPVVHRDLTPDNVIVRPDGRLVLIDFGAANHMVAEAMGTLVGKQAYMPPEQLRGQATIASDYYSFGGTLYFLLTGKDPIPLSPSRVREYNQAVPEELEELIAKLTSFEATERSDGRSLTDTLRGARPCNTM